MSGAGRAVWLALTSLLAFAPAAPRDIEPPRAEQQPTFRSEVNAVVVDASVRDRSRRAVTNLRPADFVVTDNGVPQEVDNVSFGKLPIDVTVALDVSYSVTGAVLERLRRAVGQLMRDLRREDRLKLILFNMRVTRIVDFTTDPEVVDRAIRTATAGGGTALLDAISVALVSASAQERRQLIVFFTDGNDTTSVTAPGTLTTVAQRTRGTLTFVMPALTQVTLPLASTEATPALLEVHDTVPVTGRLSSSTAEAETRVLWPTWKVPPPVTVRRQSVRRTVTVCVADWIFPLTVPVQVIVAVPGPTPVMTPLLSTVATFGLSDVHR